MTDKIFVVEMIETHPYPDEPPEVFGYYKARESAWERMILECARYDDQVETGDYQTYDPDYTASDEQREVVMARASTSVGSASVRCRNTFYEFIVYQADLLD